MLSCSAILNSCTTLYSISRPEILKQEIKVFFVKYNDPIYVKLEKLDIMIRLASQANIAQVLMATELHKLFLTVILCFNQLQISFSFICSVFLLQVLEWH